MSVKEPTPGATTETKTEKNLEQESLNEAASALALDFGFGLQAPERITIEVLKQLIRENPKKMAYALCQPIHASIGRAATLLLLVGEDTARHIVNELGEHEKALLAAFVANLAPVSLADQVTILKEFTELFLHANASLFGDSGFAKYITTPLPSPTAFENSETEKS